MRSIRILFVLGALFVGCGGNSTATQPPAVDNTPPPADPPSNEPAGPRVESESFVLVATPTDSGYTAGQAGTIGIELTPRNGWHVNMDFPTEVEVTTGAPLGVAKARLARADAAAFEEQRVRFDAALTPPAAGAQTFDAIVRFAMCNADACLPQEAHLALPIVVR